ncbi:ABC transporter ATP-binding protein [Patescibacteria group bacterium]|nr:ABC transporter ATP-binding protein [Patescibacteria group bacterium]
MSKENHPLILVKDLSKIYDNGEVSTPAVQGVSFAIRKGEFVAIIGASGSGKSTLLHILGFLDKQSSGDYFFEEKAMTDYSEEDLALIRNEKMGFIFQSFNLLKKTTVFDNVRLPLIYSRIKESQWNQLTVEAIEKVGLAHRQNYETAKLSGGERQRVAIARALINQPQIIFADEPTGNLDSHSGRIIMDIIQKLHEDGHTVVLITHEKYTSEMAERIIELKDGQIVSDSRVSQRRFARQGFIK